MIIGIVGFIGSGKSTVGDYLKNDKGFKQVAFASANKDVTAAVFGWDRALLEGDTLESREFRETEDLFWSIRLGFKVTPRKMLQMMGTEIMRDNVDDDIWVYSLEKKLVSGTNYVITDVRFPNEIAFLRDHDPSVAKVVRIKRGPEPDWYDLAKAANDPMFTHAPNAHDEMVKTGVHLSEWAWVGTDFDYVLENDSTLEDLYGKVDQMLIDFNRNSEYNHNTEYLNDMETI